MRYLAGILEFILSYLYKNRWFPRFFVLETIARVPYFAYLSVLHLYESLGFWRHPDWLKIHFAESWNEMHHLRIAEELGGNKHWFDRWFARICVLFYYWVLVFVYLINPHAAYHFNELVEGHAYETYEQFLQEHEAELKEWPAPEIAISYYLKGDLYLFEEFQTSHLPAERRPKIDNLYDVFVAIRNDEREHIQTMKVCQSSNALELLRSPHTREAKLQEKSAELS